MKQTYGDFLLARLFGFEFSFRDECCEIRFGAGANSLNARGFVHGGAVSLACDTAMGHLLHYQGWIAVTLELQTRYMQALLPGIVVVKARVVKKSGSVATMQAEVLDSAGDVVAISHGTFKRLRAASLLDASAEHATNPLPCRGSVAPPG